MTTAADVLLKASEDARENATAGAAPRQGVTGAADVAATLLSSLPEQQLQQPPQQQQRAEQQPQQQEQAAEQPPEQQDQQREEEQQEVQLHRIMETPHLAGQPQHEPLREAGMEPRVGDTSGASATGLTAARLASEAASPPPTAAAAEAPAAAAGARGEGEAPAATGASAGAAAAKGAPSAEAGTPTAVVRAAGREGTSDAATACPAKAARGAAAAGLIQKEYFGEAETYEAVRGTTGPCAGESAVAGGGAAAAGAAKVGGMEDAGKQEEEEEEEQEAAAGMKEEEEERGPSRLKFPTYEEFLKEEEEAERQEEEEAEAAGAQTAAAAEVDAAFELFMSEVKKMPSSSSNVAGRGRGGGRAVAAVQRQKTAGLPTFKTAEEECVRLTAQVFPSPFQVLLLGPDATDDDIRRQYRKLSLLIHPDKCKNPNAHEAFQVVNKAYEQLQQPEMREKYREVIEEAKRRVIKERVKENRKRKTQGIGVLPLSEDPADLQQEITDMCEKLLQEAKDRKEYAERTRQANERYEREQQEKLEKEELDKCRERKAFLDQRDERVEGWRQFQQAIHSKDLKLQAFKGVRHQREQRKEDDLIRKRQKIHGADTSYKNSWR